MGVLLFQCQWSLPALCVLSMREHEGRDQGKEMTRTKQKMQATVAFPFLCHALSVTDL